MAGAGASYARKRLAHTKAWTRHIMTLAPLAHVWPTTRP